MPSRLLNKVRRTLIPSYKRTSWSQEGEDLILARIFDEKKDGFYVDVGAHHPERFSNTCFFYKLGWRGINIDAMPGSMKLFHRRRPRDINLEAAISDEPQTLTYFAFNEPALNTFSRELARERDGLRSFRMIGEFTLSTRTLKQVLDEHLPKGQTIDFLTIDVEGLDYSVLRSNDWEKYRPEFVLAEDTCLVSLLDASKSPVIRFMEDQHYLLNSKTVNTLIFKNAVQGTPSSD